MHSLLSMWNHWVARAATPEKPFLDFNSARQTWWALSKHFPNLISAVLMPNHLHMILPAFNLSSDKKDPKSEVQVRRTLSRILSHLSRKNGRTELWQKIPSPSIIPDRHHLRRQIRYIALNPCRKDLCQDPLEWPWSTYREIFGATIHQRTEIQRLSEILSEPPLHFQVRFHAYVSGDPSVQIQGTPPPMPAKPASTPNHSLQAIERAAAASLLTLTSPFPNDKTLMKLFFHSAHRHGWRSPTIIGRYCKVTRQSVFKRLSSEPPKTIQAVDLCLGDPRLTKYLNGYKL